MKNLLLLCLTLVAATLGMAQENDLDTREVANEPGDRKYHFGLGLAKISSIGNEYNHYEKLFGSPSLYPEIWGDISLLSIGAGIDLGIGFRFGFYQDSGKSALRSGSLQIGEDGLGRDIDDSEVDGSQESDLTLIPAQTVLNVSYSPFNSRWLVLNVWAGLSFTYVENTTQAKLDSSINQSEIKPYLNSGWNQETVTGAAISIDLSSLDPWDAYTLEVHGIEAIYLTPYVQFVETTKNNVGIYDREMYGLMFTFETRQ